RRPTWRPCGRRFQPPGQRRRCTLRLLPGTGAAATGERRARAESRAIISRRPSLSRSATMTATLTAPESPAAESSAIRDDIRALARSEVGAARAALTDLLLARPRQIDAYFDGVTARLEERAEALLAANAADLEAAQG